MSELWGSMMLSLLFWQFANQITKTEEAKRIYSMFGILANLSLPVTALILAYFLSKETQIVSDDLKFIPLVLIMIFSGLVIMLLYRWMNQHVLTDPTLYEQASKKKQKSKVKLSLGDIGAGVFLFYLVYL